MQKLKILMTISIVIIFTNPLLAQKNYVQDIRAYQQTYIQEHEVVKGKDKKGLRFFTPNIQYKVLANFTQLYDTVGFIMKTSGTKDKKFYRYGTLDFTIKNTSLTLTVYISDASKQDTALDKYLFLPFTDLTSGTESYGGGRYIDLLISTIKENKVTIDFNKAYNPYCVYAYGYNCPIPPRENHLSIAILAGEKMYVGKKKQRED
jgi:uncharacterized protein (DUF1684 family)